MDSTTKYQCGCGKSYISYPAFSTHKKLKHGNRNVEGTNLPKSFNPKRGRPSFSLKRNNPTELQEQQHLYYQSLTVVELGLLVLDSKFKHEIIGAASEDACEELLVMIDEEEQDRFSGDGHSASIFSTIKTFANILISHLKPTIVKNTLRYLCELATFITKEDERSKTIQVKLDWEEIHLEKVAINSNVITEYFRKKDHIQKLTAFASEMNLTLEYFIELSIILSEWLFKMEVSTTVLKRKTQNHSNISNHDHSRKASRVHLNNQSGRNNSSESDE